MRRFLFPLFAALSLTVIALNCSSGFSVSKILCELPFRDEDYQELPEFSQPYKYLSHGRQSFVFESADGKSVIKLFNQDYFRPHWYHSLPAPRKWKEAQKGKLALRQKFYRESYPLAMKELPEESGLLYVHLYRSSQRLPSLTLIDPSGRKAIVDLNRTAFVIQKKGNLYLTHFEEVLKSEGLEGLKREIDAWIDFCAKRIEKKISDYDHDIWQNVGVLDRKILFIDPGKLYRNEALSEKDALEREWWKATHRLHKWLLEYSPEAANYLETVQTSRLLNETQSPACPAPQKIEEAIF